MYSASVANDKNQGYIPFYASEFSTLYLGNMLKVLTQLPPESVELIFADPPYNLSNDGFSVHSGKQVSVNKGLWDKSRGVEEDFKFHSEWIEACKRVLKPNGTLWVSGTYHSIYACGYALQSHGWHILNDIAWYKTNASPNLSGRMFTASHETILWARKSKKAKHIFNYQLMKMGSFPKDFLKNEGRQMRSVWAIGFPAKDEKKFGKHPTQKPVALLDRIVTASSLEGDVVLDPFCGSGTTGVAAVQNGRRFIGIDLEENFLSSMAIPRLIEAEEKLKSTLL